MVATLLLRLSGPLQSWGTQSRFDNRDTGREPSKSGVVGLLCAALGRPRFEPVDDLARLRMGVRVDQEGRLERDFHTASHDRFYLVNDGNASRTVISDRYYLADAKFLVGLEGEYALLAQLYDALRNPVWMLYLGRKAFPPAEPIWLPDGLMEETVLQPALEHYPWLRSQVMVERDRERDIPETLRLILDDPNGPVKRNDHPISFAQRKFTQRRMTVSFISNPYFVKEV